MGYSLGVIATQTLDEANNQSTVTATTVVYWDNYSQFYGYSTTGGANVGGDWVYTYGSSINYPNPVSTGGVAVTSYSRTYTHDANGYRGPVGTAGSFSSSQTGNLTASGTVFDAVDYNRAPAAPSSVTSTLNSDKSVTVSSNAVSSPAGTPTYYVAYAYSEDNATWSSWSGWITIPSNARAYTYGVGSLPYGYFYKFQMFASNSDGSSGTTAQTSGLFLPAGAKRHNGSGFVAGSITKRMDGAGWQNCTIAKRYDGSNWVNLS